MNNKIAHFFYSIRSIKHKIHPYTKITHIDELINKFTSTNLNFIDLSELDLSDYGDFFMSHPTDWKSHTGVYGWTENVIWPTPDKLPKGFNPKKHINDHKHPSEIDTLHKRNITGHGINIAIIDGVFNKEHPEYKNNIKYLQDPLLKMRNNESHFHGSMVVGCAVGKTTGVAPDASVYYFTAGKSDQDKGRETIQVLRSVLDFNKKQSTKNKIHILSCSWAPQRKTTNMKEYDEVMRLFQELESDNVKIIFCGGKKTRNSFSVSTVDFLPTSKDTKTEYKDNIVYIPTNEKTVPFHTGGYLYQKLGGDSSAAPYLAGVYACALQNNEIFMTRLNWQEELDTILKETATPIKNGGKMINPTGIVERVTQIAREMEINLIKQNGTQYE